MSNESNESRGITRSTSVESSSPIKEISNFKGDSSEEDEYCSASITLSPAKPVIDPNDSLEYESELKMLEEFYQAKSLELNSLSAPCPTYGQSFTEEEDEEYFYGEDNCEVNETERSDDKIYNVDCIHQGETTRNGQDRTTKQS